MAPAVPLRTPPHGGGMQRRRHRRAVETARSADPDPAGRARIGTAFPLLLNKLKIDPALATGPFITLTNDIIGLNIYLFTGKAILGCLM